MRTRRAFTLVELLVVLAIIGILVGLLLPSVQKVREASARVACRNNLKQIGIAAQHFVSETGRFPPGVIRNSPYPTTPQPPHIPAPYNDPSRYCDFWPWSVFLLPFLEQHIIYQRIDWLVRPWQQDVASTPMPNFKCPWDLRCDIVYTLGDRPLYGMGYQGVSGTDQFAFDGIFAVNRSLAPAQVNDGLSNTLLVGERPPSYNVWYGWWAGGMGSWPYQGTGDTVLGVADRQLPTSPPQIFRPGAVVDGEYAHVWHYWSFHDGGANFLLADGSARFIAYGTDLRALATYDGGEVP